MTSADVSSPPKRSVNRAWVRALELTASIAQSPERLLVHIITDQAAACGDQAALLSEDQRLSFKELSDRVHQYARWAIEKGIGKGDVVCLMMTNRPEYFALWLGLTSAGVVVSLLNTNLTGEALAHCIQVVAPKHVLVSRDCMDALSSAYPDSSQMPGFWVVDGDADAGGPGNGNLQAELSLLSGEPLSGAEGRQVTVDDLALYIYTSGTTGLPKAARVSHARILQWALWFAGMMEVEPTDRIYNCLPMYHSVGGVQAIGAALAGGASVFVRKKFSARQFWPEVLHWDCTIFQYIGELCRYLVNTAPCPDEERHHLRLACGNGMAADTWERFALRFRIPQILEFYASTEGGVSLFNLEGKQGAIGHVPGYLAHRFSPLLVRIDTDGGEPVRDANGRCVRAAVNEPGEALGKVLNDAANLGSRFEGYQNRSATERKILRDVLEPGDAWIRTGDLMRKDEKGFFYFVDRLGDTFRCKGENVSTTEVAEALCEFPAVAYATVYGVAVPATDGRFGMATLVIEGKLDLGGLWRHLEKRLPAYARPFFLRLRPAMDLTGTFKFSKTELIRLGFDPTRNSDLLFRSDATLQTFTPLDESSYAHIQQGSIRL